MAIAADFQQFSVVQGQNVQNLTGMKVLNVTCLVVNAQTQQVIADYTGANAFELLAAINQLSDAQRLKLMTTVAREVIRIKAGLV